MSSMQTSFIPEKEGDHRAEAAGHDNFTGVSWYQKSVGGSKTQEYNTTGILGNCSHSVIPLIVFISNTHNTYINTYRPDGGFHFTYERSSWPWMGLFAIRHGHNYFHAFHPLRQVLQRRSQPISWAASAEFLRWKS